MASLITRFRRIFHLSDVCALLLAFYLLPLVLTRPATAATLEDLLDGGTLNVGNSVFRDWELISLDATSVPPDLSQITVVPLSADPLNPGFQLNGNGQLSTVGLNAIDLSLRFRVDALIGKSMLTGHTLGMTGINFTGSGGISFITNDISAGGGGGLASTLAIADHETDFFQFTDTTAFSPKSQLIVTTNVFITGLSSGHGIDLTSFTQRFVQVGPPSQIGDYNEDAVVDAADYVFWRKSEGTLMPLPNDPVGGPIGAPQYQQWSQHFGQGPTAGSSVSIAKEAVPEPGALLPLIGLGLFAVTFRRAI